MRTCARSSTSARVTAVPGRGQGPRGQGAHRRAARHPDQLRRAVQAQDRRTRARARITPRVRRRREVGMSRNPRAGQRGSGGLSLEVFTADELREIHLATLEVLSRTGVFVEDDEALEHLRRRRRRGRPRDARRAPAGARRRGRRPQRAADRRALRPHPEQRTSCSRTAASASPTSARASRSSTRHRRAARAAQAGRRRLHEDHRRPARDRRRRAPPRRPRRAAGRGAAAQRRGDLRQHHQARHHRPAQRASARAR